MKGQFLQVITVAMDNPDELQTTLKSIKLQSQMPDRFLVVDSSLRGSQIRTISENFGADYVWATPGGVYAAMNVGLKNCGENDLVWFLNSGDSFFNSQSVANFWKAYRATEKQEPAWWVGALQVSRRAKEEIYFPQWDESIRRQIKLLRSGATWFPHPSTVVRAQGLREVNAFSTKLRIAEDYRVSMALWDRFGSPSLISDVLARHEANGISSTYPLRAEIEALAARYLLFGCAALWSAFKVLRPLFSEVAGLGRLRRKRLAKNQQ